MKKNTYIIPTIGRKSLERTVDSIKSEDFNAEILICKNGTAGENRNKGLELAIGDWIFFIDDDDYYSAGYLNEIDDEFDIVVFRMSQQGKIIPSYENENLVFGNVGINFAIKKSFYDKLKIKFNHTGFGEDWAFLKQYLALNPKIKITKDIYYNAPVANHISQKSNKFSVVIPTMWRSNKIFKLLEDMQASEFINQIVLIDNAPELKPDLSKFNKIQYYTENKNIYVNPAWNKGMQLSKNELVCICNDDIFFNVNDVFSWVLKNEMHLGVIGVYGDSFNGPTKSNGVAEVKDNIEYRIQYGHFGCLMFVKKSKWIDIPKDLKIYYGDNWIVHHNKPMYVFRPKDGIESEKHATTSDKSFSMVKRNDILVWSRLFAK